MSIQSLFLMNMINCFFKYFDVSYLVTLAGFLTPSNISILKDVYDPNELIERVIKRIYNLGIEINKECLFQYYNGVPPFIFGSETALAEWRKLNASSNNEDVTKIYEIVNILETIAPSECYIERIFSAENSIHTPLRSRLKLDTVNNIMFYTQTIVRGKD